MGEHTPVPWRVIVEADRLDEPCIVAPDHSDDFSRFVATCHGGLCDNEQQQHANAAFIVEAVNSYDRHRVTIDALVGALEKIACFDDETASEWLEKTGSYASFDEPGSVAVARAALQLARGEKGDVSLPASKEGV